MTGSARPAVSVVIPTHKRPGHVGKAVSCALAQTLQDLEVIVANDGADPATAETLAKVTDPRLKVLPLAPRRGNAGARNAGIAQARGEWVALLDDDDRWKPEKLQRQLDFARACEIPLPIVSCAFEAVGNGARFVWPAQFPRPGQPISEYLFTRSGPKVSGAIQTSTLLVPRALFDKVPFGEEVDRYVDLDWILRAARIEGVELVFVPGETLSVYSMDDARKRISNQADWKRDVEWIRKRRDLVTPRAYGGYLLTQASIRAEKSRDKSAYLPLVKEAVRRGRISLGELAFHTGNTFLPARLRRSLTNRPAGPVRGGADSPDRPGEPGIEPGAEPGAEPGIERRMRVLIFTTALKSDAAGVQGVVHGLARYLRNAGHDVVTAWPDGDGTVRDWRLDLMTDVGDSGRPRAGAVIRAAIDLVALGVRLYRFRPDVVNLHYPRGQTLYFTLLGRLLHYRIVVSFHGSDYHRAGQSVAARFPQWMRQADEVTAVSTDLAGHVGKLAPDVPVTVIANGVDTNFWTPAQGVRPESGLVVAAGRLLPVKGFDVLLEALARPGAENARLVIAGTGPGEAALQEQMRELGIADRVELAGRLGRRELRDLFRRAELFVLSSRREGMPLVLLEALASGLPAVATRVGGVPQVMAQGTGEMVPPLDPDALARAIGSRLGNPEMRAGESARARARALLFAADAAWQQYEEVLGGGGRPQAGAAAGSSAAATRPRNTSLSAASVS